jgi:CheY-like chemotaxis protein
MTTKTISPAPLSSTSTSASANDVFSPCAGVAATALVSAPFVPHVQDSGTGGGGNAALLVSVFDSDTSSAQSPQLVRSVQKPVRARQFVQLLLSMLRAEAAGSSSRSLLSPLVAAAAAAAGLPPSSSDSSSGGDVRLASASSSLVAAGKGTKAARISRISDRYPLRILLAEDNVINQKMMVRNRSPRLQQQARRDAEHRRSCQSWTTVGGELFLLGAVLISPCACVPCLFFCCLCLQVMIARKLGYEIIICENGQLVLDTLEAEAKKGKNKEIELVLMDASMVRERMTHKPWEDGEAGAVWFSPPLS